jgi:hypothetical protein
MNRRKSYTIKSRGTNPDRCSKQRGPKRHHSKESNDKCIKEFVAAHDAFGPSGDLEKTRRRWPGKTKPTSGLKILATTYSLRVILPPWSNSLSKEYQVLCFQYTLRKYIYTFRFEEILCSIYSETIYFHFIFKINDDVIANTHSLLSS